MHIKLAKYQIFLGKGALPPCNPQIIKFCRFSYGTLLNDWYLCPMSIKKAQIFLTVFILTDKISDSDIIDIPKLLGPSDLQRLYYSPVLKLQKVAVEKAEYDARFESCDVRAWRVLEMWHKKAASEATRGKLLQALEESGNIGASRKLKEKWNLTGMVETC